MEFLTIILAIASFCYGAAMVADARQYPKE
jgi:hypothetical protein